MSLMSTPIRLSSFQHPGGHDEEEEAEDDMGLCGKEGERRGGGGGRGELRKRASCKVWSVQ
jgi:hypothetical protein